jgi:hypothetical protein
VAAGRLSGLPDGRLLYKLKRRWQDGTTHVIYDPLEFIGKLAALVPPPRFNLVRYSGVLGPSSVWRSRIIPAKPSEDFGFCNFGKSSKRNSDYAKKSNTSLHERRYAWAELLKRVYSVDSLKCDRCGSRMRILCAINPPGVIEKILDCQFHPNRRQYPLQHWEAIQRSSSIKHVRRFGIGEALS